MYRSSNDIRPQWGSILSNLNTIPPLAAANLSFPGCYAYPCVRCSGAAPLLRALPLAHANSLTLLHAPTARAQ